MGHIHRSLVLAWMWVSYEFQCITFGVISCEQWMRTACQMSCLVWLTPKNIKFNRIWKKQDIFTFEKLKPANILHLCVTKWLERWIWLIHATLGLFFIVNILYVIKLVQIYLCVIRNVWCWGVDHHMTGSLRYKNTATWSYTHTHTNTHTRLSLVCSNNFI